MSARWWTFVTWALVAASAVFWGLRLFVKPPPLAPNTAVASNAAASRGDLTRLLGTDAPPPVVAAAAEPPPDARFQLLGVVAAKSPSAAREGVALIAVDGKPARAYRVGAVIDGQTIVKSVAARGVSLGPRDGAAAVTLNLAALPPAATGVLPGVTDGASIPAPPGQPSARYTSMPGQPQATPQIPAPMQVPMQPQAQPQQMMQPQPQRRLPSPQQQDMNNPGEGPGQSTGQGQQPGAQLR